MMEEDSLTLQKKFRILQCPCMPIATDEQAGRVLTEVVEAGDGGYSVAINAEKITRFKTDVELNEIVENARLVYPDGAGAVLGLRWLHGKKAQKINFPIVALTAANTNSWKVFLLGANEETNSKVAEIVTKRFPNIQIVGRRNGYEPLGKFEFISDSKPQLTMIAMGSPRQEKIARQLIESYPQTFCVGCGGAFDILAGNINRAPEFLVNNYLEWLYRLVIQPFRWRRQLVLPVFLVRLVGAVLRNRGSAL